MVAMPKRDDYSILGVPVEVNVQAIELSVRVSHSARTERKRAERDQAFLAAVVAK